MKVYALCTALCGAMLGTDVERAGSASVVLCLVQMWDGLAQCLAVVLCLVQMWNGLAHCLAWCCV